MSLQFGSSVTLTVGAVRRLIGYAAIAVPPVLLLGHHFLGGGTLPGSISEYYDPGPMHNTFVVLVMTLVVLLVYYKYQNIDKWISTVAGLGVMAIILFPAANPSAPVPWQGSIDGVHMGGAVLFYGLAAFMVLFLFTRPTIKGEKPFIELAKRVNPKFRASQERRELAAAAAQKASSGMQNPMSYQVSRNRKTARNRVYITCGIVMIACFGFLLVPHFAGNDNPRPVFGLPYIFLFESVALMAFGLAWVVKGQLFLKD